MLLISVRQLPIWPRLRQLLVQDQLVESKWSHYIIIENVILLRLLPTSIFDMCKMFAHIGMLSIGMMRSHPYSYTRKVGPEDLCIMSRLMSEMMPSCHGVVWMFLHAAIRTWWHRWVKMESLPAWMYQRWKIKSAMRSLHRRFPTFLWPGIVCNNHNHEFSDTLINHLLRSPKLVFGCKIKIQDQKHSGNRFFLCT